MFLNRSVFLLINCHGPITPSFSIASVQVWSGTARLAAALALFLSLSSSADAEKG